MYIERIKSIVSSTRFLNVWSCFYLLILVAGLLGHICSSEQSKIGALSDCFVNYSGGFVRRGLLGEVLLFLYKHGIDPVVTLIVILLTSLIAVSYFFVLQFRKNGYNLSILLSCCLLGGGSVYLLRRDMLLILTFMLIVYLYKKQKYYYWILMGNIITILCILCYEPFLFYSVPFFILLSHRKCKWFISIVKWSPSILVFLICCYFKGTDSIRQSITESVSPFFTDMRLINFIGANTKEVFKFHANVNYCEIHFGFPSLLVSIVSIFLMIYYCINAIPVYCPSSKWNKVNMLSLILFFIIMQSPMFLILSTDYGRLFSIAALCSFIVYFILSEDEILSLIPRKIKILIEKIILRTESILPPTRFKIILILLFVGVAAWSGHIGRMFVTSEVGNTIRTLYELFGGTLKP